MSEVVGWWPSGIFGVVYNPNAVVYSARLADLPIPCVEENLSKQGAGRGMHLPTSLARRRVRAHGKPKFWFSAVPPHKEEAKNESAVCELVV